MLLLILDVMKVFDSVNHHILFKSLRLFEKYKIKTIRKLVLDSCIKAFWAKICWSPSLRLNPGLIVGQIRNMTWVEPRARVFLLKKLRLWYIKLYYVLVPFECITKPDDEDVNDILEPGQSLPVKVKKLLSVKASIFF